MTQIFLYGIPRGFSTTNQAGLVFPNPGNWNPTANKIECIGAGGYGGSSMVADINNVAGGGGGGGAYAVASNMALTFPVAYNTIPSYAAAPPGNQAQASWWVNWNNSAGNVVATPGSPGSTFGGSSSNSSPGIGGVAGYPSGFAGANGGGGSQSAQATTGGAGGGGGAGGPHGAGTVGGNFSGNISGAGGAADAGNTAAPVSGNGINGTQFDHLHGIGSGSFGGLSQTQSFSGGNFGGAGGGSFGSQGTGSSGGPGLIVITYTPTPRVSTQIFLYTGTTSFPNPGNWTTNNKIECVGPGGYGGPWGPGCMNAAIGSGGGGGAYAWAANLSPTFPAPVLIPAPIRGNAATPDQSGSTWWSGFSQAAGNIIARLGRSGTGSSSTQQTSPGVGGNLAYPQGNFGGTGGTGNQNQGGAGGTGGQGGGGGAGGPNGVGLVGGSSASGPGINTLGYGGAGDNGTTPQAITGANNGTQWDNIHGIGSGSSGSNNSAAGTGYVGGLFGGGSGGVYAGNNTLAGGNGLIVISYVPTPPPPRTSTQIFLYAGVTRFPNPGNWNAANNKVEVVGTGGWGPQYFMTNPPCPVRQGAGGGGGGAYASTINSAPTFPAAVLIQVGQSLSGLNNFWNAQASTPGNVWAGCGGPGSVGGGSGNVTGYPNPVAGGQGGNPSGQTGGGGGGAGGPHGVGSAGSGIVGGAGDIGQTPQQPTGGGVGYSGTQWDNIHGIGGGGAGNSNGPGGVGGNFGAGGGGGSGNNSVTNPNNFGPGIVVLTYTPALAPQGQAQIMA